MIAFADFTRRPKLSQASQGYVDYAYVWLATRHRSFSDKVNFLASLNIPLADVERMSLVLEGDYSLVSREMLDHVSSGVLHGDLAPPL